MFVRGIWGKFTLLIFWNFEILKFQKVNSVKLSQISLLNVWLLVLIKHVITGTTSGLEIIVETN